LSIFDGGVECVGFFFLALILLGSFSTSFIFLLSSYLLLLVLPEYRFNKYLAY
jgi:hypothetical protein